MKNFNIFWVHRKIRVSGFYLKKKKNVAREKKDLKKKSFTNGKTNVFVKNLMASVRLLDLMNTGPATSF